MDSKLKALLEVGLVYILILLVPMIIVPAIYWLFPSLMSITIFGRFPLFTIISELTFLTIVLIALALTRRDLAHSGLSINNIPRDLKIAAICIITLSILPYIIDGIFSFLPWNLIGIHTFNGWIGSMLYLATEILALFITAIVLMKIPTKEEKIAISTLMVVPAMLLLPIGGVPDFMVSLIYYFVLFFVFVGPIEEFVYRGYMQSRLNDVFGRPYQFYGISYGAGLIITSLLFAFAHVTNYNFNPLIGSYSLDWGWGLRAFIMGLAFCSIREKTANIIAPSIVHGAGNFLSNLTRYL